MAKPSIDLSKYIYKEKPIIFKHILDSSNFDAVGHLFNVDFHGDKFKARIITVTFSDNGISTILFKREL